MIMVHNNYGIWIGEHAVVAITEKLQITFLRIEKDKLISILRQKDEGILGIVYGYGMGSDAHCEVALKGKTNEERITLHIKDEITVNEDKLVYKMHDGTEFCCTLAEKIILSDHETVNEIDTSLSIAKRLELWNMGSEFTYKLQEGVVYAGIDTRKYSICFNLSSDGKNIYCRVGQNGYTEKGRAMLSTVCLRPKEVRMVTDNIATTGDYKPMLECFAVDSCSFPSDGGWYWSVKEVSDDNIKLHGCGGATYENHRVRNNRYEVLI